LCYLSKSVRERGLDRGSYKTHPSDYFLWRQLGATRDALTQAKQDNANAITAQRTIAQNALTASQSNFERSSKDAQDSFRQDQRQVLLFPKTFAWPNNKQGASKQGASKRQLLR
jgi:hypothetical protein